MSVTVQVVAPNEGWALARFGSRSEPLVLEATLDGAAGLPKPAPRASFKAGGLRGSFTTLVSKAPPPPVAGTPLLADGTSCIMYLDC